MRIIINGALGHMGRETATKARSGAYEAVLVGCADPGAASASVAEGVADASAVTDVSKCLEDITAEADAVIDFSHHSAAKELVYFGIRRSLPLVIATTGHTEEETALIKEAGKKIPIFISANMSIGIAVLLDLARRAAAALPTADIEIVETHHKRKLDAPSGTALLLADGIREVRAGAEYRLGRSGVGRRADGEIGIHAVRMGDVVGEHQIHIDNGAESLTLIHKAHSRALFADGALAAAAFIVNRSPGIYTMKDMVN